MQLQSEPFGLPECLLLSSAIQDPAVLDAWAHRVEPSAFADRHHRALWELLVTRHREGQPTDGYSLVVAILPTSSTREGWAHLMVTYGGAAYVSALGDYAPSPQCAAYAASVVLDRARRRDVAVAGSTLAAEVPDADDVERTVLDHVARLDAGRPEPSASALLGLTTARLEEEYAGIAAPLWRTGIPEWDDATDLSSGTRAHTGLCSRGVTLVLGPSNHGKTTLLNRLSLGLAAQGRRVYLHGTETSREARMRDLWHALADVSPHDWAREALHPTTRLTVLRDRLDAARSALEILAGSPSSPIEITGAGLDVHAICDRARLLAARGRCDVVVVDYLQDIVQVAGQGMRVGDRVAQVGYTSKKLKDLGAVLGVPVILAAQVSGEKGGLTEPPAMHDCQWSSDAHQDAEEVVSLWNADVARRAEPTAPGRTRCIEMHWRKRRAGPIVAISLPFDGAGKWVGARSDRRLPDLLRPAL